ncbi:MAG: hypothetical protein J0L75_15780 [Spirochaetes bacterium]|nr:hypothetical protein [Spirochaetota bacterium]
MKKAAAILLLLSVFLGAQAVTATRIDIEGVASKMEFTNLSTIGGGTLLNHGWDKVNGKYRLYSELPLASNAWKQVGIKFTPVSNGEITLILQGKWQQADDKKTLLILPVYYDQVEIQGAVLKNADFEELDEKGMPKHWSPPAPKGNAGDFRVVKDKTKVKSGAASVYCWQEQRLSQTISVKAGTPVTITAWAFPGR